MSLFQRRDAIKRKPTHKNNPVNNVQINKKISDEQKLNKLLASLPTRKVTNSNNPGILARMRGFFKKTKKKQHMLPPIKAEPINSRREKSRSRSSSRSESGFINEPIHGSNPLGTTHHAHGAKKFY